MKVFKKDLVIGDEYLLDKSGNDRRGIYVGSFSDGLFFYPTTDDNYYDKDDDGTIEFPIENYEYEEV